jgi:hypothetical protein
VEYEFDVDRDDILALRAWRRVRVVSRHRELRTLLTGVVWLSFGLWLHHLADKNLNLALPSTIFFTIGGFVLAGMASISVKSALAQRRFEQRAETGRNHVKMTLNDRGLRYADGGKSLLWKWGLAAASGGTADHLFIEFQFGRAFVVPRRAVATPAEWDRIAHEFRLDGRPARNR